MLKITLLATGALLGLIGIGAADPQPATPDVPAVFEPAQRQGYFFVGGRYETVGGKEIAAGPMFVQYHGPEKVTQPYPVVMVHGTAQTGVSFLGTPDGRPGLVDRFVERGFAVYVIDQVGRGRWATTRRSMAPTPGSQRMTSRASSPSRNASICSRRPSCTRIGRADQA